MPDTFRKEYTPLNDDQKAEMLKVKEKAEELETLFNESLAKQSDPRLIATAKTYLEISILLAVKAITGARA